MKKFLGFLFWSIVVVAATIGALFGYFIYSPAPATPRLSGELIEGSIEVGGRTRSYRTYVPRDVAKGASLVVALHASGGNGAEMRIATGYGFERLADEQGFAVVYPDAHEGYWNACNIVGDYSANTLNIDDVAFLTTLFEKLVAEIGVDPGRVFAVGLSRGGHMAFRLALESPSRFRAVAAVAANLPAADNFKCRPAEGGTSSVLIMNGTKDPLNPFAGGDVKLLGLYARGKVRSSLDSAQYFADLNAIAGPPETMEVPATRGFGVEQTLWRGRGPAEVELIGIRGGGHAMPQPWRRAPRILGPTPKEPNGPALIWEFFDRQKPPVAPQP